MRSGGTQLSGRVFGWHVEGLTRLGFNLLFVFKEESEIWGYVYPHITKLFRN